MGINYLPHFFDSHQYAAEDIVFLLFELDDNHKLGLTSFERGKKVNIHIPYRLVDEFLLGWMVQKRMLANDGITKEQYTEWKLNWPKSLVKDENNE